MSIIKSNMTAPPPAAGGALSSIGEMNSLRFDGNSYLSRTPTSTGNQSTFTWSGWVKRSVLSNGNDCLFSAGATGSSNGHILLALGSNNAFFVYGKSSSISGGLGYVSPSFYRDTSAWYHIVYVVDTTISDKVKVYVNENQISMPVATANLYNAFPSNFQTLANTISQPQYIGMVWNSAGTTKSGYIEGYLANIHFIDGQALDANAFGESISGVWVPKAYDPAVSGAYGTNGFHLDFADSGNIGNDVSGNGNHWTVN